MVKSTWCQNKDETCFHSLEILVWLKRVIAGVMLSEALLSIRLGILFAKWTFVIPAEHMMGKLVDLKMQ